MKTLFPKKKLFEIDEINKSAGDEDFVARCEKSYQHNIDEVADRIISDNRTIAMVSGPSASGKTTSAQKIAKSITDRGGYAVVVSLDDFFKNIADYPETKDGKKDFESVYAVDIDRVNCCLAQLIENGVSDLPTFDFIKQQRASEINHIEIDEGEVVIIEGIHALNPLMSQSIPQDRIIKIYAGLREEYCENGRRTLATRDIRITRRLIRDYLFRGHSVRNTLELWGRLVDGEEKWIKPFKDDADVLLDTSLTYEPCVFAPIMKKLTEDETQGGDFRETLLEIAGRFDPFLPIIEQKVPANSLLREFLGGLTL
ncbi:MAG: nucleoside kinase [Oscillospiraceae bacterium]